MSKNRHSWKGWVEDERVHGLFENFASRLKWSWKQDRKTPKQFPLNTWYSFVRMREELRDKPAQRKSTKLLSLPPAPQKLLDLVGERAIKAAYEDQNEGSYEDAIKEAARPYEEGASAWRKIMRAVNVAYVIGHYGIEFAPQPRVHFLHRELLEISESEHLGGLTLESLLEFFDDVCPCGKKHRPDAIRKLKKRWSGRLRNKSNHSDSD